MRKGVIRSATLPLWGLCVVAACSVDDRADYAYGDTAGTSGSGGGGRVSSGGGTSGNGSVSGGRAADGGAAGEASDAVGGMSGEGGTGALSDAGSAGAEGPSGESGATSTGGTSSSGGSADTGGTSGGESAETGGTSGAAGATGGFEEPGSGGAGGASSPPEPPSCEGGLDCGGVSCCDSITIPGGLFSMGRGSENCGTVGCEEVDGEPTGCPRDGNCFTSEVPEHGVSVSTFQLDRFEVTVGRFRKFVAQYDGTPPANGAGAHPKVAGTGWQSAWNATLPVSAVDVRTAIAGGMWTDTPGDNELRPINSLSWELAFAFCIWDGGRLPTEAEFEYAAAGGSQNRLYPWGTTIPNDTLAAYLLPSNVLSAVGSYPNGAARWGHLDLAGNVYEYVFDWYDAAWYASPASEGADPVNTTPGSARSCRGGLWSAAESYLRSAARGSHTNLVSQSLYGLRCARNP
jgi:formylglycine-generating enzyme required for sulfatase activity